MSSIEGFVDQKDLISSGSTSRGGKSVQGISNGHGNGRFEVQSTSVGNPLSVGKIVPFVGPKVAKPGPGNAVEITVTTFSEKSSSGTRMQSSSTSQTVLLEPGENTSTIIDVPSASQTIINVQGHTVAPVHVEIFNHNYFDNLDN